VVALLGAWFFGSQAAMVGWQQLSLFKTGIEQVEPVESEANADEDRLQAQQDRLDDAFYAARPRLLPLAAASLLIGVALWIFAVGAMAGRPGARVLLCQLVTAHAALGVLMYLLTPDVRRVQVDLARETTDLAQKTAVEGGAPDWAQKMLTATGRSVPVLPGVLLGGDVLLHAAVIVALTRRRTRAFYDLARG
jgi:hypothetical protein